MGDTPRLHIPLHFIRASQAYLAAWSGIALAASIGTIDRYTEHSTHILGWVGAVTGGIMLLGVLIELCGQKHSDEERSGRIAPLVDWMLGWLHAKNVADRGTHIAVQVLTICSIGIASVNMHNEKWDWQFSLSCTLMGMVFIYNVLYTPSILVSVSMYNQLSRASQDAIGLQFQSTSYIWKLSQVEDRLMPSEM